MDKRFGFAIMIDDRHRIFASADINNQIIDEYKRSFRTIFCDDAEQLGTYVDKLFSEGYEEFSTLRLQKFISCHRQEYTLINAAKPQKKAVKPKRNKKEIIRKHMDYSDISYTPYCICYVFDRVTNYIYRVYGVSQKADMSRIKNIVKNVPGLHYYYLFDQIPTKGEPSIIDYTIENTSNKRFNAYKDKYSIYIVPINGFGNKILLQRLIMKKNLVILGSSVDSSALNYLLNKNGVAKKQKEFRIKSIRAIKINRIKKAMSNNKTHNQSPVISHKNEKSPIISYKNENRIKENQRATELDYMATEMSCSKSAIAPIALLSYYDNMFPMWRLRCSNYSGSYIYESAKTFFKRKMRDKADYGITLETARVIYHWSKIKAIYQFNSDVSNMITTMSDNMLNDRYSEDLFYKMFESFYISLDELTLQGTSYDGFFFSVDESKKKYYIATVMKKADSFSVNSVKEFELSKKSFKTLISSMKRTEEQQVYTVAFKFLICLFEASRNTAFAEGSLAVSERVEMEKVQQQTINSEFLQSIQVVFDKELWKEVKSKKNTERNSEKTNSEIKRCKRTHHRNGHFHNVWVGPLNDINRRLVTKLYPPTIVNGSKNGDELPVSIHKIKLSNKKLIDHDLGTQDNQMSKK